MSGPPLQIQTAYAELLERAASDSFNAAFPEEGNFVRKTVKGRSYWYFQVASSEGRKQRYVGAESPDLLEKISNHRSARANLLERRALVSALIRAYGNPRPLPEAGAVLQALANAGVFRLRGVLVGTTAFQTYGPALGVALRGAALQTEDVDIAQFATVSVAVEDSTPPMLDVLKSVNETFRSIPHRVDGRRSTRFESSNGLRVDFLAPNEGPDTLEPQSLPALRTDAEPLRFLDFLIYEPEPAVVLHDAGVYVLVPSPQRFAIHKLIVSERRLAGSPKKEKDLRQSEILLEILAHRRSFELAEAWHEAVSRGPMWKSLLCRSLARVSIGPRDMLLKVSEIPRSTVTGLDLTFAQPPIRYDFSREIVYFDGNESVGGRVRCAVSREALEDHFGADGMDQHGRIERFRQNRSAIESMLRAKYLSWPVDEPGSVLLKTEDVPRLRPS
ncbi:MAG TPA: GSU2403 family nucleotidyltransferase fold protein [Rhizomicrobium sp.]|nr:GSU2403 family nucleotidyltransferase fold protein [Rhizomicrobium sp.]